MPFDLDRTTQPRGRRAPARPASTPRATGTSGPAASPRGGPPGRPAGPLPLETTLARCVARRATLSRYRKVTYPKRGSWRQSDDHTLATKDAYPNHQLYAKAGKAAIATAELKRRGSGIELVETANTKSFGMGKGKGHVRLHEIEAVNTVNKTRGASMTLWADCGRSAGVVVGSTKRRAIYERGGVAKRTTVNQPVKMKIIIMKGWLTDEAKRRRDLDPSDPAIVQIQKALAKGRKLEREARSIRKKMETATGKAYDKLDDEWDEVIDEAAEAYFAYYNALGDNERDAIDRSLKINRYASPSVGEGYTISTGGDAIAGKESDTWNFHWAGVVLTSDDGKDKVVLENYSVGKWKVENDRWTFEMYGTEKKGQSFHERHFKTDLHGETPTSMTIRGKT